MQTQDRTEVDHTKYLWFLSWPLSLRPVYQKHHNEFNAPCVPHSTCAQMARWHRSGKKDSAQREPGNPLQKVSHSASLPAATQLGRGLQGTGLGWYWLAQEDSRSPHRSVCLQDLLCACHTSSVTRRVLATLSTLATSLKAIKISVRATWCRIALEATLGKLKKTLLAKQLENGMRV